MQQLVASELLKQNRKEFKEDRIVNLQIIKQRARMNLKMPNEPMKISNDGDLFQ